MLNPICHFLALLGAHHILYVSGIRVKEIEICQTSVVNKMTFTDYLGSLRNAS